MTDAKIATIYENYKQFGSVNYLPEKVEGLRKRATLYGLGISLAILLGNEMSRFTLRSPLFKLRPVQLFIVAAAPTGFLKYYANNEIEEEVRKFWRIHKTRVEKGLGGSYKECGDYPGQVHNAYFTGKFPIEVTHEQLILGRDLLHIPDIPGAKLNDGITKHNAFHDDWDKAAVTTELVESKRAKLVKPKEGSTKMSWFLQSIEDTDQKPNFGGIDNDNPFHEPPDSRMGPSVDHKLDERQIFSFRRTSFGNDIVDNMWNHDPKVAATDTGAPWWGNKLLNAPDYFTQESAREFLAQLNSRREFNILKRKWSLNGSKYPTQGEENTKHAEYQNFIDQAYEDKGKEFKKERNNILFSYQRFKGCVCD